MQLLIIIASAGSSRALIGIAGACQRSGLPFDCFITGEGVHALRDPEVVNVLKMSSHSVVCEYSWSRIFPKQGAPVEVGSQTDHSAMISKADQVVSL